MNDERVVPLVKRLFESGEVYGHSRFFADALNNIEKDRRFLTALIRHKLDLRNPSECLLEELSGALKCLVVSSEKVITDFFSDLLNRKELPEPLMLPVFRFALQNPNRAYGDLFREGTGC